MRERRDLQKLMLRLSAELPPAQVQNRLMATTDRDLALALTGLEDDTSEQLLTRVAPAKAARVREELRLQRTRRIREEHFVAALKAIVLSLESDRAVSGQRSYFRPRRPDTRT